VRDRPINKVNIIADSKETLMVNVWLSHSAPSSLPADREFKRIEDIKKSRHRQRHFRKNQNYNTIRSS
jgi:hypothetical protein